MKPSRSAQVLSWLLALSAVVLAWLVHETFIALIALVGFVREDLMEKGSFDEMLIRHKSATALAGIYAVGSSLLLLTVTLSRDSALVHSMGVSVLFVVMWPLLLM